MRTLMTDLGLVESPRWHDGRLWFADWIAGQVVALGTDGLSQIMIRHESLPLCFDFLPDGTPLIVSGPQKALLRQSADGSLATYADLSALSDYGGNDIVVDGRGNAYVNNVNYDARAGSPSSGDVAPGFVALVSPAGEAQVVAQDLAFPNGMAVTPDNGTLLVAESHRNRLTAFDIRGDGTLADRRVWAELDQERPTASASMPRRRSGTPTYRTSAASACAKAARCCRRSIWTEAPSPACSAAPTG